MQSTATPTGTARDILRRSNLTDTSLSKIRMENVSYSTYIIFTGCKLEKALEVNQAGEVTERRERRKSSGSNLVPLTPSAHVYNVLTQHSEFTKKVKLKLSTIFT